MQHTIVEMREIKLIGISVRTSYQQELDKMKGFIFPCVQKYFHNQLFEKISNRETPGITYCAYTEYESDYQGAYTYFIGEKVTTINTPLLEGFRSLIIPSQKYVKFTTDPAPMPDVVVNAWKAVWEMTPQQLGGQRNYKTDFEVYDERAADHQRIILDLYIGLQP